ncbi:MAG: metallophosphoesterase family protein [Polyangiales bacterium]
MTRIAHLSDLHLLESQMSMRALHDRLRLSFLSLARPVDPALNRGRFAKALKAARDARADHVVISGDLTEDGKSGQFEVLAEILDESDYGPDEITIVPGNHDAYTSNEAFEHALRGPLRAYRATSAPGAIVELEGATIVAVSTAMSQSFVRAAGRVGEAQRAIVEAVLTEEARRGRAVVVAMHHPPMPFGLRLGWLEGLLDLNEMRDVLAPHEHAHVMCGHIHTRGDHPLGNARIFTAPAVVEPEGGIRLYDAAYGEVLAIDDEVDTWLPATSVAA